MGDEVYGGNPELRARPWKADPTPGYRQPLIRRDRNTGELA